MSGCESINRFLMVMMLIHSIRIASYTSGYALKGAGSSSKSVNAHLLKKVNFEFIDLSETDWK